MEKRINIVKLLKDCPSGMELDCTMYDNVSFDKVSEDRKCVYPIFCYITDEKGNRSGISFTENGHPSKRYGAKCVIFPKGETTWEGFVPPCQFKDGDIIVTGADCTKIGLERTWISIFEENRNGGVVTYVDYCNEDKDFYTYLDGGGLLCMKEDIIQQRLATEEEKQKLFDAIKSNGYRWNSETKTLEKLPKFKVGDKITNGKTTIKICHIDNEYYYGMGRNIAYRLYIKNQDDWELVPVLKFKVGDRIIDKLGTHTPTLIKSVSDEYYGLEYPNGIGVMSVKDQDDWELVPNKFDITTLKPFDKVLVRDFDNGIWEIDFFSRLLDGKYFKCLDMSYIQCIPYEANKELLGTTNDCDDFYKTWEN